MKKVIIFLLIVIILFVGAYIVGGNSSKKNDFSELFSQELILAGVERVGQPIEGFDAFILLQTFPTLVEADFDGVKSSEGVYNFDGIKLVYKRTAGNPVTSAEQTLSIEGYGKLLSNVSARLGLGIENRADAVAILEKIKDQDLPTIFTNSDFSVWYEEEWFPYENSKSVIFTHDENLEIPKNTEGFAIAPWIQITTISLDGKGENPSNVEEIFRRNLWTDGSEFLVSKNTVIINGLEMTRIITNAAGAEGKVLHYVFDDEVGRAIILSHYPFVESTNDSNDFEALVNTFQPNFVGSDA